jgi:two-component system chemotaxis response regulator CheB
MGERPIRVLVVDDSAFMRTVVAQMLAAAPDIEVVGQAADGKVGLQMARDLHPDVITLDVEMPVLSGLEMLRILMRTAPTPVIMLSTLTQAGADVTIEALELGAVDYLPKNLEGGPLGMRKIAPLLIEKVRAVGNPAARETIRSAQSGAARSPVRPIPAGRGRAPADEPFRVVAIGASTGGPTALYDLIPALPVDFHGAVLVVQHMPPKFTLALAERLNRLSALPVAEAVDGIPIEAGSVLVAPGGRHLSVRADGGRLVAQVGDTPALPMMPAVDVLFQSLAAVCPERTLAVVLTGMGADGCEGARALARAGASVIAQAPYGCLVYGMPKAVVEAGIAARSIELRHLAEDLYLTVNAPSPVARPG